MVIYEFGRILKMPTQYKHVWVNGLCVSAKKTSTFILQPIIMMCKLLHWLTLKEMAFWCVLPLQPITLPWAKATTWVLKTNRICVLFIYKQSYQLFLFVLKMIAVVSEDMDVKVIDVTDTGNCLSFTGLSGPPLSVALSCDAKKLAVTSGDGFLRVWQVDTQELLKEINGLPKYNSFSNAKLLCTFK